MKGTDLSSSPEIARPATNAIDRSTKTNGALPKRSSKASALEDVPVTEPLSAPIVAAQPAAVDVPMWPVQAAAWLQPDVAPSLPARSGLSIERHNRIPSPDFLSSGDAPVDCPDVPDHSPEVLTPAANPRIPQSGLELLGWDPRTVCWKKEGK